MKSALECNPHSNVIRNFWEKKKKKSADCFRVNTVYGREASTGMAAANFVNYSLPHSRVAPTLSAPWLSSSDALANFFPLLSSSASRMLKCGASFQMCTTSNQQKTFLLVLDTNLYLSLHLIC